MNLGLLNHLNAICHLEHMYVIGEGSSRLAKITFTLERNGTCPPHFQPSLIETNELDLLPSVFERHKIDGGLCSDGCGRAVQQCGCDVCCPKDKAQQPSEPSKAVNSRGMLHSRAAVEPGCGRLSSQPSTAVNSRQQPWNSARPLNEGQQHPTAVGHGS